MKTITKTYHGREYTYLEVFEHMTTMSRNYLMRKIYENHLDLQYILSLTLNDVRSFKDSQPKATMMDIAKAFNKYDLRPTFIHEYYKEIIEEKQHYVNRLKLKASLADIDLNELKKEYETT